MSKGGRWYGGMFEQKLAFGKLGESQIAIWLRSRGNYVLPVYERTDDEKIGPRIFGPAGTFIAPDLFVWGSGGTMWIEAKHKSVFSWHRRTSRWTTGIDKHHYDEYLKLAEDWTPWPIWLLFLHEQSVPDERDRQYAPLVCPTGLFGGDILALSKRINHTHDNWGRSGMVYWARENLTSLASLTEVETARLGAGEVGRAGP